MTNLATTGSQDALLKPDVGVARRLGLAAAPTFALMAGISAASSQGICSADTPFMPLNEMALMYLLMSLFHLSPWLKFLSHRRAASHQAIAQMQGD